MILLLDTHVALWALADPARLGPQTRATLTDPSVTVLVSAATVWEVEIKRSLGKLTAPDGFAAACIDCGFEELAISFTHAERAATLPRHHTDPFDRMLIGQALAERCRLVTADRAFDNYAVEVVDALH
jgi:PIN domain nuclease of toxin-antitoxin system